MEKIEMNRIERKTSDIEDKDNPPRINSNGNKPTEQNDVTKMQMNQAVLNLNNIFLSKKRESENTIKFDPGEKKPMQDDQQEGMKQNIPINSPTCVICKMNDKINNKILCKQCQGYFHYNCLLLTGETKIDSNWTCSVCRNKNMLMMNNMPQNDNNYNAIYNTALNDFLRKNNANINKQNYNSFNNVMNSFNNPPTYNPVTNRPQNQPITNAPVPQPFNPNMAGKLTQQQFNELVSKIANPNQNNVAPMSFGIPKTNMPPSQTPPNINPQLLSLLQNNLGEKLKSNNNTNNILQNPALLQKLLALKNNPNQANNPNNILSLLQLINSNQNSTSTNNTTTNNNNNGFPNMPSFINFTNKNNNITNFNFFNNLLNLGEKNDMNISSSTQRVSDKNIPLPNKSHRFPVEDLLLYNNPDKYEVDIECFERPVFKDLNIPKEKCSRIIAIWDYLVSFESSLGLSSKIKYSFEELYNMIKNPKENVKLLSDIFISIITIFGKSIIDINPDDFSSQEKELYLVKILSENINSNMTIIYRRCWPDILRILLQSKKFRLLVTENLVETAKKLRKATADNYFDVLEEDEIIDLLYYLVNSSFDTNIIKNAVNNALESKSKITREKIILDAELYNSILTYRRNKEQRKKEIDRPELINHAIHKIELLTQSLKKLEENPQEYLTKKPDLNINKQRKEWEAERERYKSLLKENEEIDNVKEKILVRLEKIKNELNDTNITTKRLIGKDLFNNEYYFFRSISDKIFIKKSIEESNTYIWQHYDNQDDIVELINCLLEKGIKERKLKLNLKKTLDKKMKFKQENDTLDENNNVNNEMEEEVPITSLVHCEEIFKKIDEKFSEYLSQFKKEWEGTEKRNKWREHISNTDNINNFSTTLSMFNLRFKNPYRQSEEPDEDVTDNKIKPEKYSFVSSDGLILEIFEFDHTRELAPKVKLWSKDLESNDMESFFINQVLPRVGNTSNLYLAVHFYESVIFSLIKRRETNMKRNTNMMKEINEVVNVVEHVEEEDDEKEEELPAIIENEVQTANEEQTPMPNEDKTLTINNEDMTVSEKVNDSAEKNKKTTNKRIPKPREQVNIPQLNNIQACDLLKKKRKATPRDLRIKNWKETCYICGDYGELVCCDECTNVAHIFCACLTEIPDNWVCDKCTTKPDGKRRR